MLSTLVKNVFENIEGKGENAGNHHFFPFSHSLFLSNNRQNQA